ncbi:PREDICTED: UPF0496 protein At1g20180-like [Ipomoea nil]|uniref:UPF0496 protein At1g20180-like n=1 Tax=Ipomoea nil TaxID=35883 RepID=UPI000901D2EB|nr:PREDICTED: UPF0496 protein At1g20180-like [Ipomoea nil]
MWARFRDSKTIKTDENQTGEGRSSNVNEEYLCAFRTKSYSDFFLKAQQLVKEPSSSLNTNHTFAETLLEPGQETITAILDSSKFPGNHDLKPLLSKFFEISAEASKFCSALLGSLNHVQSDYKFIQQVLDKIDDDDCAVSVSVILDNPFSDGEKQSFTRIRDEYSTMLGRLKSKRETVARKMRFVRYFNKAATVLAAHTVAVLSIPLKKVTRNMRFLKRGIILRKVGEQVDVAAKGTYIVNTDLDTISRLVRRLHDEIEHNKAIIKLCLDKKFCVKVVLLLREMKKNSVGLGKQVEELQQHVYLCLVTINRLRALLINQIAKSNSFNL